MKFQIVFSTFTTFLVAFRYAQSCPTATLKLKLPSLILAGSKFHAHLSLTNNDGHSLDSADINLHLPDYLTYIEKSSKPIPDSVEEDDVIGETDIWWKVEEPTEHKKTVNFKLDLEADKCAPSHFEIYAAAYFGDECVVEVTKEIKVKDKGKKHTCSPTKRPTSSPTTKPTLTPTPRPTAKPTVTPTKHPSSSPTEHPTSSPTKHPKSSPTKSPTKSFTKSPTKSHTQKPTSTPTKRPTRSLTASPTCIASTCNDHGHCTEGFCYTEIGNCLAQASHEACLTTLNFTAPIIPCSLCPNQPASISCTAANSGSCVAGIGCGPTNCNIPEVTFSKGFCYCSW